MTVDDLCKVLIVDDEVLIRKGIRHYIHWEQEGFQIVGEASNGTEALALIKSMEPHIVITDIVMPMMDGEELTRVIKRDYPAIKVIVLSSFGDFDYVRSTFQHGVVDYILKPKLEGAELLASLKKAASQFPFFQDTRKQPDVKSSVHDIIAKLIAGYNIPFEQQMIKTIFPYSHYSLLFFQLDKTIMEVEWLKSQINKLLPKVIVHPILSEENGFTFLLNFQQSELLPIRERLKNMYNDSFTSTSIVSNAFTTIQDLYKIYQDEILKMKQYRFYFPQMNVLIHSELPHIPDGKVGFDLKRFTEAFKQEKFDIAFLYIEEYVELLAKRFTNDVFEFKSFLGNIIFNISVLLDNMGYENKHLEKEKYTYFTSIDQSTTAKDAVSHLYSFIVKAKEVISIKMAKNDKSDMQKLEEYIKQHYSEPLSLKEMAKQFHFNPSYLSAYFSSHHSEGFNEYVNKVRIEQAKKLLEQRNILISEISGMVGYSDHSYFCKVFKKITGISPSTYRNRLLR